MFEKLKKVYFKYREIINYTLFGGATTVVNMVVYYLLMLLPVFSSPRTEISVLGEVYQAGYLIANAVAFVVAVIFSYTVNRLFVFGNKVSGAGAILRQFATFFATRLLSFGIEEVLLFAMVEAFGVSEYVAKWPVAVLVVVINYGFGKLVVFRRRDDR